jgi:hypothetical protein
MRRLTIPIVILVVLVAAWAGAWFAAASWLNHHVAKTIVRLERRGVAVTCADRRVAGFPFALHVVCGDAAASDAARGVKAHVGGLSGGASIAAPMTVKVALTSPGQIESPALRGGADAKWTTASVSAGLGMSGPGDLFFSAKNLAATLPGAALTAVSLQGSLAPTSTGGTAATASFTELAATRDGVAFPPVDGKASVTLPVPPEALLSGKAALRPPFALRDLNATLASGGARLRVEGDLSVDAGGVVDGAITLAVAGADALPKLISSLPPERQKIGNAVAGALLAFGRPATMDGAPASELLIEIKQGRAKIGPVDFRVPRLPVR